MSRSEDEPLAAAMADVRVITLMQRDLTEYAQRPGLPPEDARAVEAASGRLLSHLRKTDAWVDRYAAVNGAPDRSYLLGTEPKPYPQRGDVVEKVVWFATETLRLAENIDRRLGIDRAAQAQRALQASAAKGDDPARLTRAGAQILEHDPDLRRLMRQGRLPATRDLLDGATARQRAGKLQKPPPAVRAGQKRDRSDEVAAARSTSVKRQRTEASSAEMAMATAAALAMPGEGRHLEHGKPVTEDRTLGLLNDATVGNGTIEAALLHNPWVDVVRQTAFDQRGRTPDGPPAVPSRPASPAPSRSSSPAPRRR